MTADQAREIIVDGIGQLLSRPLFTTFLSSDQIKVLKAVRDLAEQESDFDAQVASRVMVMREDGP